MKFTHRSAGPRKGNGSSPVTVKKEPKPKRSPLCRVCGEHPTKCGCDTRTPFVKLRDFL